MGKENNNASSPKKDAAANQPKKDVNSNQAKKDECQHPHKGLTFGQKAADKLTKWAGSWTFIISFSVFLVLWIYANLYYMAIGPAPDPYPFILLNLMLSCLAAIQAPVILMSQNRQEDRDRAKAERDYAVNRRAEREILNIQEDLDDIKAMLRAMQKK